MRNKYCIIANVIRHYSILQLTVIVWLITASCQTLPISRSNILLKIPDELQGTFKDDYGSIHSINNTVWRQGTRTKYHLLKYNKVDNYFLVKNDIANPSDGGLFSRIDIVYFENMQPWNWGFCLTSYNAVTLQEAIHSAAADKANPRNGCNGYPFSRMKRE